jgi:outer membrane lipoprotein SlyB
MPQENSMTLGLEFGIVRTGSIAVAFAALMFGHVEHGAAQQYYYQPSPDYYHNDTASGTVMGGAFGAVTGAIIGGKKDRGEGALIGAGVGALTGNLLGRSKDRADERQAAFGAGVAAQANQQVAALAVTNYDVVTMTRAGVSEDVIISTMRSRGAQLDLSPQSLISLKQSGVSDRVLLAAQDMNRRPVAVYEPVRSPVVTRVVPTTVIVEPAPRYYWHPHHYHHHHHHSGFFFEYGH